MYSLNNLALFFIVNLIIAKKGCLIKFREQIDIAGMLYLFYFL